jgi:hypothetical protein
MESCVDNLSFPSPPSTPPPVPPLIIPQPPYSTPYINNTTTGEINQHLETKYRIIFALILFIVFVFFVWVCVKNLGGT